MPRKRMLNTVRTDTLEHRIAHYQALGNYDAAEAIRELSQGMAAPIDEDWIKESTEKRIKLYYE